MARNNIFDIISQNESLKKEVGRLHKLFTNYDLLCYGNSKNYTLRVFVNEHCFSKWKNRGHCLDVYDFLETLDYTRIKARACESLEDFLTFIEIIFNFWEMAECSRKKKYSLVTCYEDFFHLHNVMTECLSHYNQKAWYDKEKEQVIIIEDKAEITAVAEIANVPLAMSIIRYNHRSMKGDIKNKKSILLQLAAELEPKRKDLSAMNKELEDKIFFMLNNIDLRHNNRSHGDKNYKEAVANMDDSELEDWYDELYQMMLLAFLELDQITRNTKVDGLKAKIAGGTT